MLESTDDEFDFIGLMQILGEEKWALFGIPFFSACVAVLISLYLPPMYTAKATFIVPDKQSTSASVFVDQITSGSGLGALTGGLSKSAVEMYIALMQSASVQDVLISELDLKQRYETNSHEDTRKKLSQLVRITAEKRSGVLTIEAQDHSPDFAAKLANAYLTPLRAILNRMSVEEAHNRRDFFAMQIESISQRPFRDPYLQSNLINSLVRQYETARIDESRQSQPLFQIDNAKTPESKSSPKRIKLVFFVGIAAFFLVVCWIYIKKAVLKIMIDPASSKKLIRMKNSWKLRIFKS